MPTPAPARSDPRTAIIVAVCVVYVVANWIPFGSTVLYPLTLFTTWVHEMGHGLTALLLGGDFHQLEIFANASGFARFSVETDTQAGLVAAGGLLAPPILGSAIVAFVHGPRRARVLLGALAGALALSIALYVRSVTGIVAMSLVAAFLAWATWRGLAPTRRVLLAQVLGVLLGLDTLTRMVHYVFTESVVVDGKRSASDIRKVADGLGGSYVLWGLAITALAIGMLAAAIWWAWRRRPAT